MSTVTVVAWATFAASMLASGGHVGKKIVLRVDTGVQHCNGLGQEIKRYGKVTAKTGFYFTGESLAQTSNGDGNCRYMTEVEKLGLKMGQFKVTGPSGKVQIVEEPVEISVRAYSDCTNDPMKVLQGAAGIQTVCLFTAVEKKGEPVDPTASN